ncbi:YlmC/YmxH family sporulation protein [Aneurinibacillus sp. Ricciae_BoGa-3]|uniref:YlmC/YmxH family sporulation protein n=1 Tax=Aneurinibacillus sp. Ricciae_BoGa-3 TaxID=3022697 RepID=UPI002341540E|nr:YlmC/YmxH family sporulation protein [Aneurinibacillus sp. Ricciae_BoGa-3]WCK52843.1 YlmC/YmxH family sporulation protein [Aneurinibacillus sp. Ricciae_BoGa-3]
MRFSEFGGKEIIDLNNGERIGNVGQTDMVIDSDSGEIQAIVLPTGSLLGLGRKKEEVIVPWESIRKIGSEMIIIETTQKTKVLK